MEPIVGMNRVTVIGRNLERPESVQVAADRSLYVSHRGSGITRITTDGRQTLIGRTGLTANGHELIPNGIALMPDGGFLLANIGEGGGIWQLSAEGKLKPYLMEVDGQFLAAANFVMRDVGGRIWMTVSTVSQPRFKAYTPDIADGLIIVQDSGGARIVADDICFANECRIGPSGDALYVSETFGRRVSRFKMSANGELGQRDVFCQLGRGDFPDGCRFDDAGHLWLTCIVANRVYRISPGGDTRLVLEDCDDSHVDWVETALAEGRMGRDHFYKCGSRKLTNVASIDFSPDGIRAYMGSLCGRGITTFEIGPELRSAA